MFKIVASNKFLKDLKLLKRRSDSDFTLLQEFLNILAEQGNKGNTSLNYTTSLSDILEV